jgi:hypothetical protein
MNTNQATTAASRRQSIFTIAGVLVVALAIAAGVWWGTQEADHQGHTLQAAQAGAPGKAMSKASEPSSPDGKVSNDKSMGKGETLLTQPRYPRPPEVFDAVDALATQASMASATPTTPTASPMPANPASAANPAQAVLPVGWQGAGTALQQMWDLGAQAEWKVRPAALTRPNWRISGVVQRGEQTQAIVQIDGELAPKFFKIGDTLPGGAKLAWVKPNVIGVVMPKVGALAVPVLDGQEPEKKTKVVKP